MENKKLPYNILRVSMGITFIWVSVMIFQEPLFWVGFIDPWAANLIPIPLETFMLITAAMELVIGLLMIADKWTWIVSGLAALHLLGILIGSGIDTITVRDIGLLGAATALALMAMPEKGSLMKKKKAEAEVEVVEPEAQVQE